MAFSLDFRSCQMCKRFMKIQFLFCETSEDGGEGEGYNNL